jgi:hypothetical protein
LQTIGEAVSIKTLMMRADDGADLFEVMHKFDEILPEDRMALHHGAFIGRKRFRAQLPAADDIAMDGHQTDVMQPRAEFEHLSFFRWEMQGVGERATHLIHAPGVIAQGRIESLEHMQAELHGVLQVFRQRLIELAERFVLFGHAGQLQFEGAVGFGATRG